MISRVRLGVMLLLLFFTTMRIQAIYIYKVSSGGGFLFSGTNAIERTIAGFEGSYEWKQWIQEIRKQS